MTESRHRPLPQETPRAGRMATVVALGFSGLLHGALAASVLTWDRGPAPHPAGPVLVVELVSLAPQPGSPVEPGGGASPQTASDAETGAAASQPMPPMAAISTEAPAVTSDRPPDRPVIENPEAPDIAEVSPAIAPAPSETPEPAAEPAQSRPAASSTDPIPQAAPDPTAETFLPSVEFEAAPRRPDRAPPTAFAAIEAPARPRETPRQSREPRPLETTFEAAVAEITAETGSEAHDPKPARREDADPLDGMADEVPLQTAGVAEGDGDGDPAGASGGGLGGLFSGPSFHLGSARNPLPRYPAIARRRGWEGRVVLRVEVGTDGHPLTVDVVTPSDHPVLNDAARKTIRRWRFEPGRRAGLPVTAFVEVPVVFKLRN